MKRVTIADVAKKANVSKSTVSQYLNNRFEYMSEATKENIEKAIADLNYVPNFFAKSLKLKRTSTIGVIVANILHTFSTEIIRAIEDVCEHNEYHLFVCNADDNPKKEREYIETLIAKQVDGLIIFPTDGNADYYDTLRASNFPVVFVDRRPKKVIYPTLTLDNHKAAKLAVDTLIESGKKDVAVVSTAIDRHVTPRLERIEGYKIAMLSKDVKVNENWIIATQRDQIQKELENLWTSARRPNAFFAINDLALIELLKFFNKKAIKLPEEVAVIGIDDSPFLEIASTPITIIEQPTFEMGKDAAKRILKLIDNEGLKDKYEVKLYAPSLIKRKSV